MLCLIGNLKAKLMADDHDLLIRIDERTERSSRDIKHIKTKLSTDYVTKEQLSAELGPVRKIAYGIVAGMGAIVIAGIGLFTKK